MKKKVIVAVLAASMLMMTACGSTQETTATSNSEEETTAEVTTEATTAEEESETTETETTEEDLIPLYCTSRESDFRQMEPEALYNFTNFAYYYFPLSENGRTFSVENCILYDLEYGNIFSISADPVFGEGYDNCDFEICLFEHNEAGFDSNVVSMYYKINDTESSIDFIPYYYNPTKHCLVGYYKETVDGEMQFVLSELYYAADNMRLSPSTVNDTSEYESYF